MQLPVASSELLLLQEQRVIQERQCVEYVEVKLMCCLATTKRLGYWGKMILTFLAKIRASFMRALSRTFSSTLVSSLDSDSLLGNAVSEA
jgi:hypothetical protein